MSPRERLFALEHFGIKLGLDNIHLILDALERPQAAWQAVHVAGTNGKGSVTAMVERGLRAAGHHTGRYTSPHLNRIEERIAIDGRPIDSGTFDRAAADVLDVVDRLRAAGTLPAWPTFFEVTTAMAFEIFRRSGVEIAAVEVGLGGRFDATNVLAPAVTAIVSIALDHERHLGSTVAAIAFEKAGIIKPSTPVVVGELPGAARGVVVAQADLKRAPLIDAGRGLVASSELRRGRAAVVLRTPVAEYDHIVLGLNGAHQVGNAVVAARTLEVCRERGIASSPHDVVTALSDVEWPARLEWLRVDSGRHILIDAAHNPAGALALAEYLRSAGVAPLPVVLAVMQDKDVDAIVRALAPVAAWFVATEVKSPRCTSAVDLAARLAQVSPTAGVVTVPDAAQAAAVAIADSARAVVAGSIFLAGPSRARLLANGARPVNDPF
jgi:dihydrofolate synthase/folylpolyglutamate synthase